MGKTIAFLFILVLCSFTFVTLHLALRRPAVAATPPRVTAAALQTRDDGSVYAVSLELEKFERRLVEEEKRSATLLTELETLRQERERLTGQVDGLQSEVRRLRRQVNGRARPSTPSEETEPEGETDPQTQPQPPVQPQPTLPGGPG